MDQRRDADSVGGTGETSIMTEAVDANELRALARDRNDVLSAWEVAAIAAAADQLEAATALIADVGSQRDYWADRAAAVERVADMAQDDEDGNGWVPVDPLLDALYPEKRDQHDG